jgi:RHS repeat-associated protein
MGEAENGRLGLAFDGHLRLEFRGAKVTTDAGLLAIRELDGALGLTAMAGAMIKEKRTGKNIRHQMEGLLQQSVYARLAGYEDVNDQEALSRDPAMRAVIGRKALERNAASSQTVSRFETETLATEENIGALAAINGAWVARAMRVTKGGKAVLDMDSSQSPVHGNQEGSAYNGHFCSRCYHPLFVFNQYGDCEGATLRPGNVHSAEGWRDLLEPIVERYMASGRKLYFRGDAAFASPELYEYLEDNKVLYAIRIKANGRLYEEIDHLMVRPVGRPPKKPQVLYHDFLYRAGTWDRSRRVIAKIEWHQGELFPRVGFIVTNLSRAAKNVVRFYNQRGNCEQYIKEGKYALSWTRLSCSRFISNQVRLALFILAYNPCGWATEKTDPLGRSEAFTYNEYGDTRTHIYTAPNPDRAITYTYDGRGGLKTENASESGNALDEIDYSYDHSGNMKEAVYDWAGGVNIEDRQMSMAYDASSRLDTVTCALGGDAGTYSTSYEYYDSGELASRTLSYDETDLTTLYRYDISGRLTGMEDPLSGDAFSFAWDPDSRLSRVDLPSYGGHLDYTYYGEGLTHTQAAYSSTDQLQAAYDYAYNDRGKRTQMDMTLSGSYSPLSGDYSYAYDGMGRLDHFNAPGEEGDISYMYDKCGNLERKTTGTQQEDYDYDAANQITTGPDGTYTYDAFGNLAEVKEGQEVIKSYTYDGFSRLIAASEGDTALSFTYDPYGRLYERKVDEETERAFRYDGTSLSQSQEADGTGNVISTYALSPDGAHLAQDKQGTLAYLGLYPHTDVSFSLSEQGNLTGSRVYDPYGNPLAGELDCSLGYQEDYTDPTSGLIWMGARWYSPELTRFLSVDPLKGETDDPLSLNPYLYCKDDPINAFDPTGMGPEEVLAALEKAITATSNMLQNVTNTIIALRNAGLPVPQVLIDAWHFLHKTLIDLIAAYDWISGMVGDEDSPGSTGGGGGETGPAPPSAAEEAVAQIVDAVKTGNEQALQGSLGAILSAAVMSENFDEFLKQTDIDILNEMSEQQKAMIWREIKKYLCPGYTEMTFDGKYLELSLYTGGGNKIVLFKVDAYSGQPGGGMAQENVGPIPAGAWRLTRRQGEDEGWAEGFGEFVIRLRPAGEESMEGSTMNWIKSQTTRSRDNDGNFIQEGVFLIHEDAAVEGTAGCIGVLGNRLDVRIEMYSVIMGVGWEHSEDEWSNTYLFVDYPGNDQEYRNPEYPGQSWLN